VGYRAGDGFNNGWNNTIIGANSDMNGIDYFNSIALGSSVTITASNQARIGNSSTTSIGGFVNWTNISDGRYKKDIRQDVPGLGFIMKLKPVTYHLDIIGINNKLTGDAQTDPYIKKAIADKESMLISGFVAQDVERAAKEAGYDFSGVDKPKNGNDFYGLRYADFVVPLVKAVQEQQQVISTQQQQINDLKAQNEEMARRLAAIEQKLAEKN
jgi:hypothetical protein